MALAIMARDRLSYEGHRGNATIRAAKPEK